MRSQSMLWLSPSRGPAPCQHLQPKLLQSWGARAPPGPGRPGPARMTWQREVPRPPPVLLVSFGSCTGDSAITMSTSARKRLMRDFKRLQVRRAHCLAFRTVFGSCSASI